MNSKILIVDDSRTDILVIESMLQDYNLISASNGLEALDIIRSGMNIDLIILDLCMPEMDGFAVLSELQKDPVFNKISTIILTNMDETENEIKGLSLGAMDYIRKPLNMEALRKRVEVHLNLVKALKKVEEQNASLEKKVEARTSELVKTRDATIHALLGLLEIRDIESSNHTKRTQWMMKVLCEHLSEKKKYQQIMTEEYIMELFQTAPLHDIGKVGIPDKILLKPGKLDHQEIEIMKRHTMYGVEALSHDINLRESASFIQTAVEIVGYHHERYDGTGYPNGIKGEEIPLAGRLMAIIDVYDALTNKRVYKHAYEHSKALEIIKNERGKHFDPDLVDAFIEIEHDIRAIAAKYMQNIL